MLTVNRKLLGQGLRTVAPTVGRLSRCNRGVSLEAFDGHLLLFTTDLDRSTLHQIECTGDDLARVVVPYRLLTRLVGSMSGDDIRLGSIIDRLAVESGRAAAAVKPLADDTGEFPTPQVIHPRADNGWMTTWSSDVAAEIARVLPLASNDYCRPILCMVHFTPGFAEATDSYRLGRVTLDTGMPDCLVHAGMLREALRHNTGDLAVHVDDRRVRIASETTQWFSTPNLGEFPNAGNLIPKGVLPGSITVNRGEFTAAARRMARAVGSRSGAQPMRLEVDDDVLTVSVSVFDEVDLREEVTARTRGDLSKFALNPEHMCDVAQLIQGDDLTFDFTDSLKPVRIIDGALTAIMMPVRVS